MRFYKKHCVILFFSILIASTFIGCKKEHLSFYSFSERLTRNKWIPDSFVNENSNTASTAPSFTYEFNENGVFTITSLQTGYMKNDTWELINNNEQLRIGNDFYSIDFLSNKLLCLYYGNVRITLVPYD